MGRRTVTRVPLRREIADQRHAVSEQARQHHIPVTLYFVYAGHGNVQDGEGYISLEDGCVGGFVQRALQYNDSDSGVVMMGGHDAESQSFRASEAAIRGFWKKYRALTGT